MPQPWCSFRATAIADPAHADDAERAADQVLAEPAQRVPRLPAAFAGVLRALAEPAGRGDQQRDGDVGGRLGQDAGRVADADAALGRGAQVDVVEADGEVADDLQLRGGVEQAARRCGR